MTDIALARENIVTLIKSKQAIVGVSFVKPSEILAKLFAAMPVVIPKAKIKYPANGFISLLFTNYYLLQ